MTDKTGCDGIGDYCAFFAVTTDTLLGNARPTTAALVLDAALELATELILLLALLPTGAVLSLELPPPLHPVITSAVISHAACINLRSS